MKQDLTQEVKFRLFNEDKPESGILEFSLQLDPNEENTIIESTSPSTSLMNLTGKGWIDGNSGKVYNITEEVMFSEQSGSPYINIKMEHISTLRDRERAIMKGDKTQIFAFPGINIHALIAMPSGYFPVFNSHTSIHVEKYRITEIIHNTDRPENFQFNDLKKELEQIKKILFQMSKPVAIINNKQLS